MMRAFTSHGPRHVPYHSHANDAAIIDSRVPNAAHLSNVKDALI